MRHTREIPAAQAATPPVRKRYSTVIRNDGTLLPIEERLGRRLLRTLAPSSREARRLLAGGRVSFLTSSGVRLGPSRIRDVLACIEAATRSDLARHGDDPAWRAACRSALQGTRQTRLSLPRDH